MTKRLTILAALAAALMMMAPPPRAVGQDGGWRPDLDPGFIPRVLPNPTVGQDPGQRPDPPPDFALRVWVNTDFNDGTDAGKETAALHGRVKDFLNKARLGVPEDRVRFFEPQWENCPPIVGWKGMVYKVAAIKGGYAVTLEVGAVDSLGGNDSLRLYEHYMIVGGKVKYRGYTLPPPGRLRVRCN